MTNMTAHPDHSMAISIYTLQPEPPGAAEYSKAWCGTIGSVGCEHASTPVDTFGATLAQWRQRLAVGEAVTVR